LLEFYANLIGQLLLRGATDPSAMADTLAYMDVNWMLHRVFLFYTVDLGSGVHSVTDSGLELFPEALENGRGTNTQGLHIDAYPLGQVR
jgi:hypothetical protein